MGYPHLNVKIAGSHAGISTGEDGATHQCCEDIALMRTIPGMVVLNPSDHYEMLAAVKAAAAHQGPVYIRLGRLAVESINNNDDYHFELGKGITSPGRQGHHHCGHGPHGGRGRQGRQGIGSRRHRRPGHQHPYHQAH